MKAWMLAALAALVLAGCDDSTGPDWSEFADGATAAEARWRASGPLHYVLVQERDCACQAEERGPVRIEVTRNGATETVVSMTYVDDNVPVPSEYRQLFLPVTGLFELIREAARAEVAALQVTYGSVLGYPSRIQINWVAEVAEDDVVYSVTALQPL